MTPEGKLATALKRHAANNTRSHGSLLLQNLDLYTDLSAAKVRALLLNPESCELVRVLAGLATLRYFGSTNHRTGGRKTERSRNGQFGAGVGGRLSGRTPASVDYTR